MEECKPIGVPLDLEVKLQKNANGNDESKGFPYQQAVGSLMYAMLCTRLNLAYPISVLSQHMANLNTEH
jgi:ATP-binding cassette subfamily B (MDR/TAP) protein 1